MSEKPVAELTWHRSTACESGGSCVEIAASSNVIVIRSSVSPDATVTISQDVWRKFLATVKGSRFGNF